MLQQIRNKGILIIYSGGTIGSRPRDVQDPESPQVVVLWEELKKGMPEIEKLSAKFKIDAESITPLDSCNVGPDEWKEIAQIIFRNYDKYEGFVILHGTDTMVYTASALSFMLANLAKPVILTGAQRSALVDSRNDASQNLLTAIELANPGFFGRPPLPEVCVYFGGRLLRGNRSIKRDTSGYMAYESPNFPDLAEVGDAVVFNTEVILPVPTTLFRLRDSLEQNVTTVMVYPGIQTTDHIRRQILETPGIKGVIVMGYGSGNVPTLWPDWLDVFKEAAEKEILVLEVSQCRRGPVELGIYETSALLVDYGFVSCYDITLEAALTKMQVVLADPDLTFSEKVAEFTTSLAGEQSVSTYVSQISSDKIELSSKNPFHRLPARQIEGRWTNKKDVKAAILRLRGVKLINNEKTKDGHPEQAAFHCYFGVNKLEEASVNHSGYAGKFRKEPGGTAILTFDVTAAFVDFVKAGERASMAIQLESSQAILEFERAEFVLQIMS